MPRRLETVRVFEILKRKGSIIRATQTNVAVVPLLTHRQVVVTIVTVVISTVIIRSIIIVAGVVVSEWVIRVILRQIIDELLQSVPCYELKNRRESRQTVILAKHFRLQ